MIQITLKGGTVKEYQEGISVADIAKDLSMGLYKAACAARVDGTVCDLRTSLDKDCQVEILTFDDPDGKKAFWHTASHVLDSPSYIPEVLCGTFPPEVLHTSSPPSQKASQFPEAS